MSITVNKYNDILVRAYHNTLQLEETKRKYSRTTTSFRGRNAMEYIYEADGSGTGFRRQSEIADFLRITRPSCTVLLDKLEKLGYITRVGSKSDERSTEVYLTRKGRLVTMYQSMHRNRVINEALEGFTPEEQEVIYRAFQCINDIEENCMKELEAQKHKERK